MPRSVQAVGEALPRAKEASVSAVTKIDSHYSTTEVPRLENVFGLHIRELRELVEKTQEVWARIVQDKSIVPDTAIVEDTLLYVIRIENDLIAKRQPLGFYSTTSSAREIGVVSTWSSWGLSGARGNITKNRRLFSLIEGLTRTADEDGLTSRKARLDDTRVDSANRCRDLGY
jgi:hypothetical protein